jgi:hypothetical protein
MPKQRPAADASSPASLETAFLVPGVVPRSARRAAARRASSRRAAARELKRDVEGRVIEYLKIHPAGTTGEIAKALDADRGRVAAELARLAKPADSDAGPDIDTGPGGPRIIDDRKGDDRLDEWVHNGPSSEYTFLPQV